MNKTTSMGNKQRFLRKRSSKFSSLIRFFRRNKFKKSISNKKPSFQEDIAESESSVSINVEEIWSDEADIYSTKKKLPKHDQFSKILYENPKQAKEKEIRIIKKPSIDYNISSPYLFQTSPHTLSLKPDEPEEIELYIRQTPKLQPKLNFEPEKSTTPYYISNLKIKKSEELKTAEVGQSSPYLIYICSGAKKSKKLKSAEDEKEAKDTEEPKTVKQSSSSTKINSETMKSENTKLTKDKSVELYQKCGSKTKQAEESKTVTQPSPSIKINSETVKSESPKTAIVRQSWSSRKSSSNAKENPRTAKIKQPTPYIISTPAPIEPEKLKTAKNDTDGVQAKKQKKVQVIEPMHSLSSSSETITDTKDVPKVAILYSPLRPLTSQSSQLQIKDLEYKQRYEKCSNKNLYPKGDPFPSLKMLGDPSPLKDGVENNSYTSAEETLSDEVLLEESESEDEEVLKKVNLPKQHKFYNILYEKPDVTKCSSSYLFPNSPRSLSQEELEEEESYVLIQPTYFSPQPSLEQEESIPPLVATPEVIEPEKPKIDNCTQCGCELKPKPAPEELKVIEPSKCIKRRYCARPKLEVVESAESINECLCYATPCKGVKRRAKVMQTNNIQIQSCQNRNTFSQTQKVKIKPCCQMKLPRKCCHEKRMLKDEDDSCCELKCWNYENIDECKCNSNNDEIKITKRDFVLSDRRIINLNFRKRHTCDFHKRAAVAARFAENCQFKSLAFHFEEQRCAILSNMEVENNLKESNGKFAESKTESNINWYNYIKKELKKRYYKLAVTDHYLILNICLDFNNVGVQTECLCKLEEKDVQVEGLWNTSSSVSLRGEVSSDLIFDVYQNFDNQSIEPIKDHKSTVCTQQQNFFRIGNGCNAIYSQLNIQAYIFLCNSNSNANVEAHEEKLKTVNRNLFLKFV